MITIRDEHTDGYGNALRWVFGTNGKYGRFAGASANGELRLHGWEPDGSNRQQLVTRTIKCATMRKATRRMRQWLKGYNV